MRIASVYLPNGNPIGTDKFTYKLAWMDRLGQHAERLLADKLEDRAAAARQHGSGREGGDGHQVYRMRGSNTA